MCFVSLTVFLWHFRRVDRMRLWSVLPLSDWVIANFWLLLILNRLIDSAIQYVVKTSPWFARTRILFTFTIDWNRQFYHKICTGDKSVCSVLWWAQHPSQITIVCGIAKIEGMRTQCHDSVVEWHFGGGATTHFGEKWTSNRFTHTCMHTHIHCLRFDENVFYSQHLNLAFDWIMLS